MQTIQRKTLGPNKTNTTCYTRGLKLSRHSGPQLKQIAVRRAALIFVRKKLSIGDHLVTNLKHNKTQQYRFHECAGRIYYKNQYVS